MIKENNNKKDFRLLLRVFKRKTPLQIKIYLKQKFIFWT